MVLLILFGAVIVLGVGLVARSYLNATNHDKKLTNTIAPIFIRSMGFPDQNLEARIGAETWHGQEALDHMKVLVTSVDTDTSFQTGHEAPIVMPGTPTTPTKSN